MAGQQWVERSYDEPYILFRCRCGWEGRDADVEDWDIQTKPDRAVRVCPSCGQAAPEWGTLRPLDGAARIARGPLQVALVETGVVEG